MSRLVKWLVGGLGILLVLIMGVYAWASWTSQRLLASTVESHAVAFPVPFPLEAEVVEADSLDAEDEGALALARARERGRHLLEARYACADCHGEDFGGGVMIDAPVMGRVFGPNLTSGSGGRTVDYTPADWDRAVRHGILPDGRPSAMPAVDFRLMSDQELSDIIAYIQGVPPVDNETPPLTLGPLGRMLLATGRLPLSAHVISDHYAAHEPVPPAAEPNVAFGRHLAGVCTGCHAQDLAGGPITGGDPSWAPARNLTPHPEGLGEWTFQDFEGAMRRGVRPDGTPLLEPMTFVRPYGEQMTDTEMRALWLYLRSMPPVTR